jgi:hypothetical protein
MPYTIAAVLLILWLLGWLVFEVVGAAIHILVILALLSLVMGFLRRKRA